MKETRGHKILRKLHPSADWLRVETWTQPGVFDSNACYKGTEVWVELKQVPLPKRKATLICPKVRLAQIIWEKRRRTMGGRTFIALMVGSSLYILPGKHLQTLSEGIPQELLFMYTIDPKELFNHVEAV